MSRFKNFYNRWIQEQERQLEELRSARQRAGDVDRPEDQSQQQLVPLIDRVVEHYENYYRAKAEAAGEDVLRVVSPEWTSTLENSFMWLGGWRPSMAFHLVHTNGIRLEGEMDKFLEGVIGVDRLLTYCISPEQLNRINELQQKTIEQERKITEKLAKLQNKVSDQPFVELAEAAAAAAGQLVQHADDESMKGAIENHTENLEWLLEQADEIRLSTLKGVVGILSPLQSADFLAAAAALHLFLHQWGVKIDNSRVQEEEEPQQQQHAGNTSSRSGSNE